MHTELGVDGSRSLQRLFGELVWRHFFEDIHLDEPQIASYVSSLLVTFSSSENLRCICNSAGRSLDDVGEMLIASNPLLDASSFERERQVRKHVGDYTLFMTGLFPECVGKTRDNPQRLESFVDFVHAGKESYAIVSSFDQFEHKAEAPVFRNLSENFELCVVGLNLVKQDLQDFQRDYPGLDQPGGEDSD
jgi:hypothetical protein